MGKVHMQSLRELYRIGYGPSSSHTMGVANAAKLFTDKHRGADRFKVILYASLAETGKGHCTDTVLIEVLSPSPVDIVFDTETEVSYHPNTLDIFAYKGGKLLGQNRFYSTGGGAIEMEGEGKAAGEVSPYEYRTLAQIKEYCSKKGIRYYDYVYESEPGIKSYLREVWEQMKKSIDAGLKAEGTLPGGLQVLRQAKSLYNSHKLGESDGKKETRIVCAYAYAVAEENAAGGMIVTAPTCGASGVLPAVLFFKYKVHETSEERIIDALATAGLIGNLIKTNATISGAEAGCQAEIGAACCMAAAAYAELNGYSLEQIEYAACIAMEHHLGLTCDPVCGLVQIPCIERNAVAARRAKDAARLCDILSGTRVISFDLVVETMYETGKDLHSNYRETSKGGLAKLYRRENHKACCDSNCVLKK